MEPGDFVLVSLTASGKSIRKQDFFLIIMEEEKETNQVLCKYGICISVGSVGCDQQMMTNFGKTCHEDP